MERDHICAPPMLRFNSTRQREEEDAQDGNAQHGYARTLDTEHGKLGIAL